MPRYAGTESRLHRESLKKSSGQRVPAGGNVGMQSLVVHAAMNATHSGEAVQAGGRSD